MRVFLSSVKPLQLDYFAEVLPMVWGCFLSECMDNYCLPCKKKTERLVFIVGLILKE